MTLSKINTGEVLKQYMLWTVAVGWHSATVRWCLVLVSQPTSHEWVLKCVVKEWWGRNDEREVEITSLSQIALLRSKSMLLEGKADQNSILKVTQWHEVSSFKLSSLSGDEWHPAWSALVYKSTAPQTTPIHGGSSYFSVLSPLISYKVADTFPTATAWYHWHNYVRLSLSIAASLSHPSLNTSPGSPRCHCCYICMGLSDCCTSVHMCLFSKSTTNVTLNTLDCSSEQPCLLHVAKQT